MARDIFTEPDLDPNTLDHLGPLTGMAGIWEGTTGVDVHPVSEAEGLTETDTYLERYELQPIDPQTNGPQYFYGLRYHVHVHKPNEVETFHDQVGYWLWNPVEQTVTQTIAIPRAQVALASAAGVAPDATEFTLHAERGTTVYGICSNPFLETAYTTVSFRITVTINPDGTWSYDEDTVLQVEGRAEPFHHTDVHTLTKVAEPTPNPLARVIGV
jgi:hypothetical protein